MVRSFYFCFVNLIIWFSEYLTSVYYAAYISWREWCWSARRDYQGLFLLILNFTLGSDPVFPLTESFFCVLYFTFFANWGLSYCPYCIRFWVPLLEKRSNAWIQITQNTNFHRSKLIHGTKWVSKHVILALMHQTWMANSPNLNFLAFPKADASWGSWSCIKTAPVLSKLALYSSKNFWLLLSNICFVLRS